MIFVEFVKSPESKESRRYVNAPQFFQHCSQRFSTFLVWKREADIILVCLISMNKNLIYTDGIIYVPDVWKFCYYCNWYWCSSFDDTRLFPQLEHLENRHSDMRTKNMLIWKQYVHVMVDCKSYIKSIHLKSSQAFHFFLGFQE